MSTGAGTLRVPTETDDTTSDFSSRFTNTPYKKRFYALLLEIFFVFFLVFNRNNTSTLEFDHAEVESVANSMVPCDYGDELGLKCTGSRVCLKVYHWCQQTDPGSVKWRGCHFAFAVMQAHLCTSRAFWYRLRSCGVFSINISPPWATFPSAPK